MMKVKRALHALYLRKAHAPGVSPLVCTTMTLPHWRRTCHLSYVSATAEKDEMRRSG